MKVIQIQGKELKLKLSPSFMQNAACPAYLKFHYVDKIDERWVRVEAERPRILEQQSSPQFIAARQHVRGLIHDEAVHAPSGLEAVLARREPSGEGTS